MAFIPRSPHIYEINTWTWLHSLSVKYQRPVTLGSVPDEELKILARPNTPYDAIWLMGVWERSLHGVQIARHHPGLQAEYDRALPDYTDDDVAGSPYAVRRYVVDIHLGGREELAAFRERLQTLGLGLILDFVPNHVATDHAWAEIHPEVLLRGTSKELANDPDSFLQVGQHIFAHGRDPYFPAWTDTLQVNAFSPALRKLVVETLLDIAAQCDGVRCDMAMLVVNEIFAQTWGERAGDVASAEYWEEIIPKIRQQHPEFLFLAEVYWDMEARLHQLGFDYCYDKRLYDRMAHENAASVLAHLNAPLAYQNKLIRFIENHDEMRTVTAFGVPRSKMAAVLVATLPGAKLWHDGQPLGYKVKLPVQLGRRPIELPDKEITEFYRWLFDKANQPIYRDGIWEIHETIPAWPGNISHHNMIAYVRRYNHDLRLIVVNFSNHQAQCRVRLTDCGLEGKSWKLADKLNHREYERNGDRMVEDGLYIDLTAWNAHIFEFSEGKLEHASR
ncbi:MAG: alpha-amylase [Anaerolineae bacterium]|nr:alpha-amylase [Anaerolineae bacterium]